jgi:pepF/M3 family oligoendopeptidase
MESPFDTLQDAITRLIQAGAFCGCLSAQNVKDRQARILGARVTSLEASLSSVFTAVDKFALDVPDDEWEDLLGSPELKDLAFNLDERRRNARKLLPPEQETLINDLSVDGYHGWSDLYNTVVGRMVVPVEKDGQVVELSPGQAANWLTDADRSIREKTFAAWEKAWGEQAELCATAMNHIGGYRLALYGHRGWDSILKEPLRMNRMTQETLDAMWNTIERNKYRLVTYLRRKQKLLGIDQLSWHDVNAPLGGIGGKMSYDEAANFVVDHYAEFSPKMAAFAERAFRERWVEAEDRPAKRPGAFCTDFAASRVTRVFTTFGGTITNVGTLAHELGHGYHGWVMVGMPILTQQYSMNVAETASTMGEMIVGDAAVRSAATREEKIDLLDDKLQNAVALLMNIHSRFLFETRFYEERARGMVSVDRLNEIMVGAQKDAFQNALDVYHPHFWASKLHFYFTDAPFYNFPYTFGYLFSAGVYSRALAEGRKFAEGSYLDLLRDTGRMQVEDLARKHLGADLTGPEFWQSAIDVCLGDLDEFLRLTE